MGAVILDCVGEEDVVVLSAKERRRYWGRWAWGIVYGMEVMLEDDRWRVKERVEKVRWLVRLRG